MSFILLRDNFINTASIIIMQPNCKRFCLIYFVKKIDENSKW